ncbi:universal stress protein [Streptomyces sp. NPDC055952]|uniref:universal stress protein n=1 Tax=Streptomyces sp. NPDC055952 TaxID=3345663 RepID=UPI0035D6EA8E
MRKGAWPVDRPVTVGVDGSPSSMRALDWAADEAALHGRPLRVVYASAWERFEGATPAEDFPEGATEAAALERITDDAAVRARRRRPEVGIQAEVLPGEPVDVLVQAGEDAFVLVVGHRGHGALARRLFTGSVGAGVAERVWCPVVVVGDSVPELPSDVRQIVVGIGEGADADAAHVAFALQEAQARGCDLVVVHARSPQETRRDPPGLHGSPAADALLSAAVPDRAALGSGVVVRGQVIDGPPQKALLHVADHADLLVLGVRHGHGMVCRELGPTHHAALRHAPCPVALVPGLWASPHR